MRISWLPLVRLLLTVLALVSLLLTTPQNAIATAEPCTWGDAQTNFQTLLVSNEIFLRHGVINPRASTLANCQWRFYWEDGHPVFGDIIFSEDDVILGGLVVGIDYANVGMTRQEAITILEGIQIRTWIAEVKNGEVGELVEQPLTKSAFKDVNTKLFTGTKGVVQHWAFITQLPAGEYVSVTEYRDPDPTYNGDWTVKLTILPQSD